MSENVIEYKGTDIVVSETGGLLPRTFEGLWRMSQIMAASGLMPKGIEKPEAVFVAVQFGLEIGLSPMQAVQNIAPINGRPTLWGDAMLGIVRSSGLLEEFKETNVGTFPNDNYAAVCTVKRVGFDSTVQTFSVADAKKANLWGKTGPWQQYPKRMLQMRARSWALRDAFGDVLKGLRCAEEAMDFIDMKRDEGGAYGFAPEPEAGTEEVQNGVETDFAEMVKNCDPKKMDQFLEATAKANSTSVEAIKEQALQHRERFLASFDKFAGNNKPKEAPQEVPSFRDEWINLRDAGFKPFVLENLDRFRQASAELQQEARKKWSKFYGKETFPLDNKKPDPKPAPSQGSEETKGQEKPAQEPKPNGQDQGNGPTIWQVHDAIQKNDPNGYMEALQAAGFDNEPGDEDSVRKIVAAYQRLFEAEEALERGW